MQPIYIPRLTKAPEQTERIEFNELIPDLDTLTPIQGAIRVKHCGTFLDVKAKAETIVTLTCDRCLQQYNHRLVIKPSELIWLNESAEEIDPILLERDITSEDLVETLSPTGYFDPTIWIYEQLCLEIPQRQLCDKTCQGIDLPQQAPTKPVVDRRWAGLEALKDQLSNQN
jgi:uncharacterized protein